MGYYRLIVRPNKQSLSNGIKCRSVECRRKGKEPDKIGRKIRIII